MGLWDLFRRRTADDASADRPGAGPASSAGAVPEPPAARPAAWRSMAPVQRAVAAPDLVTAPARFPDNLVSWRDPTLHTGLGHVVSPEAPSGLVHNLAVVSSAEAEPPPASASLPASSPASPSEILETYSRKMGTGFPRSEQSLPEPTKPSSRPGRSVQRSAAEPPSTPAPARQTEPSAVARPVRSRPLVSASDVASPTVVRLPVQRSITDSSPPPTESQPAPDAALDSDPQVPTLGQTPLSTSDSGTPAPPAVPRRLGLGAPVQRAAEPSGSEDRGPGPGLPVQRMFDLPGVPDLPRTPTAPKLPDLPSAPELPGAPGLPSIPDLPQPPDLPSGVAPPGLPSLPEPPSLPDLPSMPEPADAIPSNPGDLLDQLPSGSDLPVSGLVGDDPLTGRLPQELTDAADGPSLGELANGLPLPGGLPEGLPLSDRLPDSLPGGVSDLLPGGVPGDLAGQAPSDLASVAAERLPVSDLVGRFGDSLPVSLPPDAESLRGLLPEDAGSVLPQAGSALGSLMSGASSSLGSAVGGLGDLTRGVVPSGLPSAGGAMAAVQSLGQGPGQLGQPGQPAQGLLGGGPSDLLGAVSPPQPTTPTPDVSDAAGLATQGTGGGGGPAGPGGGETVGGSADAGGADGEAGGSGTPAPEGGSSSPTDVDTLVRRLYEPIARRLKAELRLDRERAGFPLDLRH